MAGLIDAVVGHRATWDMLQTQAKQGRMAHALAFVGPSGIGKRKVAWALAQALVCEAVDAPCGVCPLCRRIESQQSESVLSIEAAGSMIKIESAQQILQFLNLQRLGRARVVIVDGAQWLNPQAGNSLLKIIEEPPPQTFFIFLLNEISQLMTTLRSRVQVIRFAPLSEVELQRVSPEPAPTWMLRSARGSAEQLASFRDAHSEELRGSVLSYLRESLAGRRAGIGPVLEQAKDREGALSAIHMLQQLLRDWSVAGSGSHALIHTDLSSELTQLPVASSEARAELWKSAFQMELDLASNVDKSLLFENFFYRARASVS